MPFGLLTMRLPLSSTSVRCAPSARRLAYDAPPLFPLTEPDVTAPPALFCVIVLNTCSALVTPALCSSVALMLVTGSATSLSIRLISEPVTSTRSID